MSYEKMRLDKKDMELYFIYLRACTLSSFLTFVAKCTVKTVESKCEFCLMYYVKKITILHFVLPNYLRSYTT